MLEVFGVLLGGVSLAHRRYKTDKEIRKAGHPLLVGCKTQEEIITVKCECFDCYGQPMSKLTPYELDLIERWIIDGRNIRKSIKDVYYRQTGKHAEVESKSGNNELHSMNRSNDALSIEIIPGESCDEKDLYYMSQQRKENAIYIDAKNVDLTFRRCVRLGFEVGDQGNYNYWYKECKYYKTDKNRMTPNEYLEIRNKRYSH